MRILEASLLALAISGAAHAQSPLKDENVLVPLPGGFKLGYQTRVGPTLMAEFVPANETVETWTAMVTQQTFRSPPPQLTIASMVGSLSKGFGRACGTQETTKIGEAPVNNYPSEIWRIVCPMNPATSKPEYIYIKLIKGADALYSVQYAFRAAPSEERNRIAETYLAGVRACDTRTPEHPCPSDLVPTTLPQ